MGGRGAGARPSDAAVVAAAVADIEEAVRDSWTGALNGYDLGSYVGGAIERSWDHWLWEHTDQIIEAMAGAVAVRASGDDGYAGHAEAAVTIDQESSDGEDGGRDPSPGGGCS